MMGPKLLGFASNVTRVSRKSSTDTGKIASKKLDNDDAELPAYALEHDKSRRNTNGDNEEEEVIEFETEETPKRNYNINVEFSFRINENF